MRTRTAPENTILSATTKAVRAVKIEIKDAVGAYQDWFPHLLAVSWGATIDQPIVEVQLRLKRDAGPGLSLSPFRGDSTLNIGGAAIDSGRDIRISPATSAWGVAPVAGDYKQLFTGKTGRIDFANSAMEVIARDLGSVLVRLQIKERIEFRSETGVLLEDVIQELLDVVAPAVSLYTPVSTGKMVTAIDWGRGSLFEAIRTAVGSIGWDIRYLWDDGTSTFRLTLFEPERTKTTPDWTFAANRYGKITQLGIDPEFIRNFIRVTYRNAATGARQSVEAFDAVSIARFGEQWAEIEEEDTSPIDSEVEAQAEADAANSDLAWPIADKRVEMPFFWAIELNDLIRFSANNVHSDEDIDLAVSGYEHRIDRTSQPPIARTTLSLRGKPAGFYKSWLRRGSVVTEPVVVDPRAAGPEIEIGLQAASGLLTITVESIEDAGTWWLAYAKRGESGGAEAWPTLGGTDGVDEIPDRVYQVADFSRQIRERSIAAADGDWYVVAEAIDTDGNPGPLEYVSTAIAGGSGGPAGQLSNVRAALVSIGGGDFGDRISWDHDAVAGTYTVTALVSIDGGPDVSLVTGRDPELDGGADTVPDSGYYDTAAIDICNKGSSPACEYHQYVYTVQLKNGGSLVATYTASKYQYAIVGIA